MGTNGQTFRRRRGIEVWKSLGVLGGVEQLVMSFWYCDEVAGSQFRPRPDARVRQDSPCRRGLVDLACRGVNSISRNLMRTVLSREFIC